jgi:hypothetical protein
MEMRYLSDEEKKVITNLRDLGNILRISHNGSIKASKYNKF